MDAPMYLPHHGHTRNGSSGPAPIQTSLLTSPKWINIAADNDTSSDSPTENDLSYSETYLLKPVVEPRLPYEIYKNWLHDAISSTRQTCIRIAYQAPSTVASIIYSNVKGAINGVTTSVCSLLCRPMYAVSGSIGTIRKTVMETFNAGRQRVTSVKQSITDTANTACRLIRTALPWAVFYLCIFLGVIVGTLNDMMNYLLGYIRPYKVYRRDAILEYLPIYDATRSRAFSFCGCSWLVLYHAGAGMTLQRRLRREVLDHAEFLGASSGTLVATAIALGFDLEKLVRLATQYQGFLGPVGVMSKVVEEEIRRNLQADDDTLRRQLHRRLTISLTRFPEFSNELRNEFDSKDDLIDCILATSHFPVYMEKPMMLKSRFVKSGATDDNEKHIYVDGGFTNNQPCLSKTTITISPHPYEANITPKCPFPLVWSLLPPSDNDVLRNIVEQGRIDADRWLNQQLEDGVLSSFLFR
ncbi:hypothetical protein SeMB42_g07103 [Synchytrium endobioticum]|uniref:PNPLA domain-containing protein n=1 Tax=Synchytrium endobioticum TaxID=286115 RepID=A0A507CF11_9FUNG|nr:hypothetical protein SeMB42_g07103 [Synchytrium endobioticum]TPX41530.1 hypothetical protein SeLEV6574_g06041 [Synchytrium endobioticum]